MAPKKKQPPPRYAVKVADGKKRCPWPGDDSLYVHYHDTEWGVPVHDDQKLFEFLILEGMQAGLSWITILRKRENFRKAFDNFDAKKMLAPRGTTKRDAPECPIAWERANLPSACPSRRSPGNPHGC